MPAKKICLPLALLFTGSYNLNMNLSLYIHIPFCRSKCFYCSFASFENKEALIEPYLEALRKEAVGNKGQRIDTVYIGGGTPTHLNVLQLKLLFDILFSNFNIEDNAEITIEANPATFDEEKAKVIFDAGVTRVSLGVQSLDEKYLRVLGRPHSPMQAISSLEILRQTGFKNISLDLIYSLPGQTKKEIEKDCMGLLSLGSEHVSLYSLTIAEGSEFHARKIEPLSAEKQGEDYCFVVGLLKDSGFKHYEVSNFAKSGFCCRHNINYWQGGNYIGLGAAAHSHINGHRHWNIDKIDQYIDSIVNKASSRAGEEKLAPEKRFVEALLVGLRLIDGIDIKALEHKYGAKLSEDRKRKISDYIEHGLLAEERGCLKVTLGGMLVLDEICSRLI